ncbi:MAG: DUF1697 domain-containing protein [Alphaproteobacteria bacterium]|nr:DUF1697 domain-containing protein [Alphaproteobacteria bacterium]
MHTSIAFLRGMNLGGRRITNDALQGHFEALGFRAVRIYRASGNVIFQHGEAEELTARIEQGLEARLGYPVTTFLRSAAELAAVIEAMPFTPAQIAATAGKIQVTFLPGEPGPEGRALVAALSTEQDRLALGERALYWLPTVGISTSELDLAALERALGVGTTRTLGTLQGILKKCA